MSRSIPHLPVASSRELSSVDDLMQEVERLRAATFRDGDLWVSRVKRAIRSADSLLETNQGGPLEPQVRSGRILLRCLEAYARYTQAA